MLSSFLLIPPKLTSIIESQEGFQDFKSAVRVKALAVHMAELDFSKSEDATKGYVGCRTCSW